LRRKAVTILLLAATGLAGWVFYSYSRMKKPIPDEDAARTYAGELFQKVGMGHLYGTWEEEWLDLPDRRLALYHFKSQSEDPVLVFVPGTSVYALLYTWFMHEMRMRGFNVVGFDPRGHGMSSGPRGVYTLGQLLEDALAVVDHTVSLYGERVAVAGSSQGGMVAFYCAASDTRLKAAVCHNVIAPDEPDNERMTRWPALFRPMIPLLPALRPLMASPLGRLMVPVALYLDLKNEPSRIIPDVVGFLKEDPLAVNAVSLGAFLSLACTPLARKVEEIRVPVMIVHGGRDNIFPEDYVRRVYERLACEKEFLLLPEKPHLVMTDYVDEIVPPIAAWLKKMME